MDGCHTLEFQNNFREPNKNKKRARHHRWLRRRHLQARKRTSDAACPSALGALRARCCLFLKRLQVFRREAVTGMRKRQMARRGNGCYMVVGWMMGFKATSIPYYAKSIFPRASANFSPVALPKDRRRVRFHKIASCSTGRGRQSQKLFKATRVPPHSRGCAAGNPRRLWLKFDHRQQKI